MDRNDTSVHSVIISNQTVVPFAVCASSRESAQINEIESPLFPPISQEARQAVISPSATPSRAQVDVTVEGLRKWGYVPVEGKYVCTEVRTVENCREDLEWALNDPEIKAVFCVRGGKDLNIPVAFGFPAGHGKNNYPLLMGEELKLTVTDHGYTLEWVDGK